MQFDNAQQVDSITWEMKMSDYPRAVRRTKINELLNGLPPYTPKEVQENGINVNFNDLTSTRLAHDARSQVYTALLGGQNYFNYTTVAGPVHKRQEISGIVTSEINRMMKRSLPYFEYKRSQMALEIAHGIGPGVWIDSETWAPDSVGIDDILVPANTRLDMRNVPFFSVYRTFTAPELIRLTRRNNVDPGWNMPLVDLCIKQIDSATMALRADNWPEMWSPEKVEERVKGDGGYYQGDAVPTINTFDFYYWDDSGKSEGWRRRIVLDAWSSTATGGQLSMQRKQGDIYGKSFDFLYSSKDKVFSDQREKMITFQFADLSAVGPFRYHTVRSLGYLLYAVCHMQNRLRCKFTEAVFEALMMYFRVNGDEDVQRVLKVNLINKGFVDKGLEFLKPEERYQVDAALVELGLRENEGLISRNASSFSTPSDISQSNVEKTKFQVMSELNATTQLVGAALTQIYQYQVFEGREIMRRFFVANSRDVEVRQARNRMLNQGVPEECLIADLWDCQPERVMGDGNRTMELAIAQQLMQYRNLYDPEPQREILRDVTLAITRDPARAKNLVPDQPQVSDSVMAAQYSAAALMLGLPMPVKSGINHQEYIEALLADMAILMKNIGARDNMGTPAELKGLQGIAQNIAQHIQLLSQDEAEGELVRKYGEQLGQLINALKGFAQRLSEKMQSQNGDGNELDPEVMAKIQAMLIQAKAKAENARESHAQKTAQRQVQFEQETQQRQAADALDLQKKATENALDLAVTREKAKHESEKPEPAVGK